MKKLGLLFFVFLGIASLSLSAGTPESVFTNFITRSGDKLMDGQNEFRFVSFNMPNLHYVEDYLPFVPPNVRRAKGSQITPQAPAALGQMECAGETESALGATATAALNCITDNSASIQTTHFRLPDAFEITDALASLKQMGCPAVRTYTLSVRKKDDDPSFPRYILGPGKFNEEAFRALDRVLETANKTGVRLIIPFVDQASWFGGIAEYAAFRGKGQKAFWTDPQVMADFKETIRYVLNRTNTITGVKYKDNKAILAWETGNELDPPASWTKEIARYIKSVDPNHLVMDGADAGKMGLFEQPPVLDPNIDILTTHHYSFDINDVTRTIKRIRNLSTGKKAYIVGEFGFMQTPHLKTILDTVIQNGTAGAMIWSLRSHNREGGFYWHSEPFGGDKYKAYHWPGFPSGAAYDETNTITLMREKAFEIRGASPPPIEPPQAPTLLPIPTVGAISWQGAVGASSYDVERATSADGPWQIVGKDVDDTAVQYRSLFSDTLAKVGDKYFYRVTAKNSAGRSTASNVIGPVEVKTVTLVDEMKDFSLMNARSRDLSVETKEARRAKEDIHRIKGKNGSYIIMRTDGPMQSAKLAAFFMGTAKDFKFSASSDGKTYAEVKPAGKDLYPGGTEYHYWNSALYTISGFPPQTKFLKIEFKTDAQIGRLEIEHGS